MSTDSIIRGYRMPGEQAPMTDDEYLDWPQTDSQYLGWAEERGYLSPLDSLDVAEATSAEYIGDTTLKALIRTWHALARRNEHCELIHPFPSHAWASVRSRIHHQIRLRSAQTGCTTPSDRGVSVGGMVYVPNRDGGVDVHTFDPI
jgi:hypothetical protein